MFDWDDLRLFLAAARAGSLTAAAQPLGVDAATVGRRVARLETALKATLFVRSSSGLQLTAAGAHLLEKGLNVEEAMQAAAAAGQPDVVGGTVRIGTAEGFGTAILAPALPALRRARPGLRIELAATSELLSPSRREVDLAVSLSAPGSPRLVVEPLTHYQLALYASPAYLQEFGAPDRLEALSAHALVGYVDDLIHAPELRYFDELGPGLRPTLASSSLRAQREIIAAGGGIGVLPCFLAQGLTCVLPQTLVLTRRFWISTHRDVAATARVRAVRAWLKDLVQARAADLAPFDLPGRP
ncbi:DNA-binding transcriptional LysR family regulator [Caulobacter ginsengisoli]|uniref:DNA-binding transcriptional LysR family regulator n=1 Tax=Caulobacter ginsengisoli TaxID=400775 RepID=A0ABU0ITS4_9CAUL|nr:LysR family transcriptional regulator [Caulobacter ginsengisoli]MDQ0464548.1 DNA-binding transcriptional LysR family regulator [Caulobacter ginsengisoli]